MKTTSEFLEITAASGGKKPSVKGLAYSGGKMRLFGWSRPVVVDMAGMNIPESVPLLTNHVNDTLCRVGVVMATKGSKPKGSPPSPTASRWAGRWGGSCGSSCGSNCGC